MSSESALVPTTFASGAPLPAILTNAGESVIQRVLTFFTSHLPNAHTAEAYARAVLPFLHWCDTQGLGLEDVQAVHISGYLRELEEHRDLSETSLKARLAGIRSLFRFLVEGGFLRYNPAHDVRGPKLRRRGGKTPHLEGPDMRKLLDAIETESLVGLRDRALISTMAYAFPRVSTALRLRVGDFESSGAGYSVYLRGKGGEQHRQALHHEAASAVLQWLEAAGITEKQAPLFQGVWPPRGPRQKATGKVMQRNTVLQMVKRRAERLGMDGNLCTHSFRATGITAYVEAGGSLQTAAQMAGHADVRTTQLYVRSSEKSLRSEVERIRFE
ncbi:MAG: tyrosine-type recombinase/integrase [Myxococcota bacterium]